MKYTGANTLQPYISKVLLENLPDGRVKVIVRVAMSAANMLEGSGNSMKTTIVKVCDPEIIKKLSRNSKATNIELIDNAREEGQFGNLDLSVAEVKYVPRDGKEIGQGYYITNVEFVFNDIVNLTFYVVCQHDMKHPKFARIVSSKHFKTKVYNDASVFAEDVFRSGRLVKKSKAFVYDDAREIQEKQKDYSVVRGSKRIWTGPVQRYSNNKPRSDGYVGYVAHGLKAEEPRLKLVEFPNTTIHDYRILEKISNVPFNCKIKESAPSLINPKGAYFSNLCITNDNNGLVKIFFAVDVGEIIKDNVKIPRFVSADAGTRINLDSSKSSYEDVINLSLIKSMTIRRHEIDSLGNMLSGGEEKHTEKIVESSQAGLKLSNAISRTSYPKNDDINNIQTRINGAIREVDNLYTSGDDNKNIRFFTVTDNSMINEKHGNYRYSVELDIEDGSIAYLQELYKSLKKGLSAFQSYHHAFTKGNKLDKSHFVQNQGPWIWTLNILIKTIRAFQEDLSNEDLEEKLYILASPNTCTLESLAKVVKTYEKVLRQIKNIMDELPTKSKRDIENMKANSVISGVRKFTLLTNLQHTFTDVYEPSGGGESGYQYLPTSQVNIENEPGLLTINSQDFMNRATQETLRYFTPSAATRFSPSQLSYLTPMSVKIKNNLFITFTSDGINPPTNNAELANFNALLSLYNFKKYGTIYSGGKDTPRETTHGKADSLRDNLYANQLNAFSHHVKNNLSNAMSNINVVGSKKYDSPCFEKTEQQEKEYAQLMMPNTTNIKYKAEISSKGVGATHSHEEVGETVNLSSIFAPLFYMKHLNIYKELSCLIAKMNTSAVAAGLPNQLQALLLENRGTTTHQWYDATGASSLKTLNNAAFHYLNNKNLVNIEVLTGFTGGQIKAPIWVSLREFHIDEAAANRKTNLLCRMRTYSNDDVCFVRNDFLDLNIFNQCFLLDVSKVSVSDTQRKINRRIQPLEKMKSLENNDFLKLESALMRTNLLFGQVIKQRKRTKRTKRTKTQTTQGTSTTQTSTTMTTTNTMGPPGGTSGGGVY